MNSNAKELDLIIDKAVARCETGMFETSSPTHQYSVIYGKVRRASVGAKVEEKILIL